jgi:hypothetical protein
VTTRFAQLYRWRGLLALALAIAAAIAGGGGGINPTGFWDGPL